MSRARVYPRSQAMLGRDMDRAANLLYSAVEAACVAHDHHGPSVDRATLPARRAALDARLAYFRAHKLIKIDAAWRCVARSAAAYDRWTAAGRPVAPIRYAYHRRAAW